VVVVFHNSAIGCLCGGWVPDFGVALVMSSLGSLLSCLAAIVVVEFPTPALCWVRVFVACLLPLVWFVVSDGQRWAPLASVSFDVEALSTLRLPVVRRGGFVSPLLCVV